LRIAVATLLTIAVLATMAERTFASEYATSQDVAISDQQQEVDDNDDTRVEVQLVVLGIVIGTVFVFGSVLYLVRRRLGLVPPPPEPGVDAHH
jgi:hypothetical protein